MKKENLIEEQLENWVRIASSSHDEKGLEKMLSTLFVDFSILKPDHIEKYQGKILHLVKRKTAPLQILFGGHMDTVFTPETCKVERKSENILQGAGVADMKGGLMILLSALDAFEKTPESSEIGWEIFINHDEEIGSPFSTPFIQECAGRCDVGLIFEPAFPDGSLVSARKGSANYTIISRGKAAHVGRDFHEGKNAIVPLAKLIVELAGFNDSKGVTLNVGKVEGGGPVNKVPDLATIDINIRFDRKEEFDQIEKKLKERLSFYNMELIPKSKSMPKPFDSETEALFHALKQCGEEIALPLSWKETGGVSDGNVLASCGLPTIDTMGVVGGKLHTSEEYLELDSLPKRSELTTHFLTMLALKKFPIRRRR